MEQKSKHWSHWCRLCAKEDPENHVNLNYEVPSNALGEDIKFTVNEALERYFWIQASKEDIPTNRLCTDCYSYLIFILKFGQRVQRVQQMFTFLMQAATEESCDLKSIRLKFDVLNENRHQWYHPHAPAEAASKLHITKNDCEPVFTIKHEHRGAEEIIYDEEYLSMGNQEEDEDPFKYNDQHESESSSGVETRNETSHNASEVLDIDLNVKRCKKKRKRRTLEEIKKMESEGSKCKKKEVTGKDFPLDVSCTECAENFSVYSTYYKHLKMYHANAIADNRWKCPTCDSTLQTRDSFKRHMGLHMPADRLPIRCTQCDNRYLTNAQLKAHLKQRHSSEKPYICEECGLGVTTLTNLKRHIITHSDETPFECEMCKKNFKSITELKRHCDTHGPNKHVCTICGLELNSRTTLRRHFLVHSDKMQHKCDYCGRAFKRSKTLKTHLLLHTGLKPYSCDFCERTFANGSNCRSHMKKMHPVELAGLEASGGRTHTQNIPKLENLKALTKNAEHLKPVAAKASGCFPLGKM